MMESTHICAPRPLLAVLIALLVASPSAAQSDLERFERQLEQIRLETLYRVDEDVPVAQRTLIDYGGYLSSSYLSLDDNNDENHVLWQHELIGYGRLNIDGVHEMFIRGRWAYRDFHSGDAFDNSLPGQPPDAQEQDWEGPELERLFYRFDLRRSRSAYVGSDADFNVIAKGGRDLVFWANGLTLVQVLDGAVIDFVKDPFVVEFIAGVTPEETVDFDPSRPNFDDDTRRGFYGVMVTAEVGTHQPFVYALLQRDYNEEDRFIFSTEGTAASFLTRYEYNSWYIGIGSSGPLSDRLLYGVEFVYEGGEGLSGSAVPVGIELRGRDQFTEDIEAWAADLRLDYLLTDPRDTRFSAEAIFASGDDDRDDTSSTFRGNAPGTDDNAFNGFGLLNTGQSFAGAVSNMMAFRVGASTFPLPDHSTFRRMQVGVDFFVFNKLDPNAPIDEESARGKRYLGFEPDFFLNWQMTSDLSLAVRYGLFFPNEDTFGSDDARHFFYTSLTLAF